MPLLRIDLVRGRSEEARRLLLDTIHEAVLEAFQVPSRDRYQLVTEHDATQMIIQDTGLDIPRTSDIVVIHVVTRRRSRERKELFYRLVAEKLQQRCGIAPSDVMMTCVVNSNEDWSFGFGRAQFLTGQL